MKEENINIAHNLISSISLTLIRDLNIPCDESIKVEVVQSTVKQISSMPAYLWIAYRAILQTFNLLAIFYFGNIFLNLSAEKRLSYIKLWANSPIKTMRDFIKPIRSCTLYQFFDHPTILEYLESK